MTAHTTTQTRVRLSRRVLRVLLAAVLTAGACWAVLTFAVDPGTTERTQTPTVSSADALKDLTAGERRYVQAIARLTPEQIAAAYAPAPSQLTAAERRYLKGIASMSAAQVQAAYGTSQR
jgi:hypothetical protein